MVKNLPADAGGLGSTPGLGGTPGKGNGNPLQYSCLENFRDRGVWWTTVHGVTESDTTEATYHACIALETINCSFEPTVHGVTEESDVT